MVACFKDFTFRLDILHCSEKMRILDCLLHLLPVHNILGDFVFVFLTDCLVSRLTSAHTLLFVVNPSFFTFVLQTLECKHLSDQYVAQVAELTSLKSEVRGWVSDKCCISCVFLTFSLCPRSLIFSFCVSYL